MSRKKTVSRPADINQQLLAPLVFSPKTFMTYLSVKSFQLSTNLQRLDRTRSISVITSQLIGFSDMRSSTYWPSTSIILTKLFRKYDRKLKTSRGDKKISYPLTAGNWLVSLLHTTTRAPNGSSVS